MYSPKNYKSNFLPCTLLGSDYSEGARTRSPDRIVITAPPVDTALTDAGIRINIKLAVLPASVLKAVWKIEDHADELTACEVYARGG